MTESQFALLLVGVLFMGSTVFWAWHSHLLVNKLMSRNYFDFTEASKPKQKVVAHPAPQYQTEDYSSVNEILN